MSRLPPALPIKPVELERRRDVPARFDVRARVGAGAGPGPEAGAPRGKGLPDRGRPEKAGGAGGGRGPGWTAAVIFRISLGADAKAEPGWLLPLICRRGGVTRKEVGAIRVGPRSSTFEIAAEAADDFALASAQVDPRAPHVTIEPARREGGPRPMSMTARHPPASVPRPASRAAHAAPHKGRPPAHSKRPKHKH